MPILVDDPRNGDGRIYEVKYGGYRTKIHVDKWGATALTRRGLNWTEISGHRCRKAPPQLQAAILDGEVILPNDAAGRFSGFRSALVKR